MRRPILAVLTALQLCGCAALRDPYELAWQGANVVDALQTATLHDDPCLKEGHPLTRALIGENPSRESVAAWAIGGALLHAGVTNLLLERGWLRSARAWQLISLSDKGVAIAINHSNGVRIGSKNVSGCAL